MKDGIAHRGKADGAGGNHHVAEGVVVQRAERIVGEGFFVVHDVVGVEHLLVGNLVRLEDGFPVIPILGEELVFQDLDHLGVAPAAVVDVRGLL